MNRVLKFQRAGHKGVRKRRNLRRNGIHGSATHSRNRNSHGAGSAESPGAAADAAAGHHARNGRRDSGGIFSFALMGLLRSLVFGVTITDPVTFLAASAILTAAAVLACWIPSRKVIRMDPMIALRHE